MRCFIDGFVDLFRFYWEDTTILHYRIIDVNKKYIIEIAQINKLDSYKRDTQI